MSDITTDVLIVGAGLAGLYTALNLDARLRCLIVTKEGVELTASWLAQGGIAAAISADDTPQFHLEDTLRAGAGLCDEQAVRALVDDGPTEVARLRDWKVPFDLNEEGELHITREGGHTHNRIVHAGGDATGRETVKVLAALSLERPNISYLSGAFLVDLLLHDGRVCGAQVYDGGVRRIFAGAVVLCTGGCGQLYEHTTNPAAATGDGVAAALRAGAALSGMEFVQFHPTALYSAFPESRAFLISEAVRGEGGRLVSKRGERFMATQHPMGDLAPRDIVARGIVREMRESREPCVYLDVTDKPAGFLAARFPTIFNECARRGLDISVNRIPVCPAQHYMVGGIRTGLCAETTLPGLYAVGENACTGVHGGNRLASNSMLECLVYGRRAARHIGDSLGGTGKLPSAGGPPSCPHAVLELLDPAAIQAEIRRLMERDCSVTRTERGLARGLAIIRALLSPVDHVPEEPTALRKDIWECRNLAQVAERILCAALLRRESAGCHYREEY